jgi:predicted nuclease of restriction endonuclease-like (RecB) superfamily
MANDIVNYASFIKEIKELVRKQQYEAMRSVNVALTELYWEIGFRINQKQKEQGWGKSVIEVLAKELQKEFPGNQGFSARNLRRMQYIYFEYSTKPLLSPDPIEVDKIDNSVNTLISANYIENQQDTIWPPMVAKLENQNNIDDIGACSHQQHEIIDSIECQQDIILQPLVAELENEQNTIPPPMVAEFEKQPLHPLLVSISWSKNVVIIEKCKDSLQREFYIRMTKVYGWTKNVLINNIENRAYEKYLTNQTNFDNTLADKYKHQAKLAVKDEYNFEFIEMGIQHSEAEFELGLLKNIRAFLMEMGGDFSFIGNQYPVMIADETHYIDLLLFHRRLRCLVAIELKIGEFEPEYTGKMQFYLSALNDKNKLPEENPAIGIIVCKSKNRTKVEYALNSSKEPMGVATYSFYDALPKNIYSILPTPEDIANIIKLIGEK